MRIYENASDVATLRASFAAANAAGQTHSYQAIYDPLTGKLQVWRDNSFLGSWTDTTPLTSGSYLSLRTDSADVRFDDLVVSEVVKYYEIGGQRVAVRKNGAVSYLFGDHLGSTSVTANASGTRTGELWYKPWGEYRGTPFGTTPTTYRYTGQREDASIGLYYYGARYYDPALGRFYAADTLVPGAGNPQALNRYSYTLNNPLKYNDPTGHWVETAFDVLSLGMTINDIRREGLTFWNAVSLVTDVASVALPIVPAGASHAIRAGKLASKAINAADTAADAAKLLNAADAAGDAAKLANKADNVADAAKLNPFDVPCSFDADTPVLTPAGLIAIQTLQSGDLVFAYDEATDTTGIYTITGRAAHLDPAVVTLTIGDETIDTTPEHPFYVAARGWVEAGRLAVGDRIRRVDGSYGVISTVELVVRPEVMYNLTVADAHTFFVGEDGWLVHNCPVGGAKSGETVHTIRGREAHNNYPTALGGDYVYNRQLPSGARPDAIDWNNNVVRELKPDNPRAIQRGQQQVNRYQQELEAMTGKKWQAYVDVYQK